MHREPVTRKRHQSGAGHPADEEASGDEEDEHTAHVADLINQQQRQNVNEDVVPVPSRRSLFADPTEEAAFFVVLNQVIDCQVIPDGFGLKADEWEDGCYPIFETIRLGRRRSKELEVSLANEIWYKRACMWCQALVCMVYFTNAMGSV